MSDVQMLHNPRCSKSRETLALLLQHGETPQVVLYLEQAHTKEMIRSLLDKLDFNDPRYLMRTNESVYKELGLDQVVGDALIDAMVVHPILIERPIVICGNSARIGRPPERVLEILPTSSID